MIRSRTWGRDPSRVGPATPGAVFRLPVLPLSLLSLLAGGAAAQTSYKYDFGSGPVAAGYTQVTTSTRYSATSGFGFENASGVTLSAVDRGGADALRGDHITGTGEIFFSVKVPQGNYNVTFILGDASGASETTVECENQRLLFDRVTVESGHVSRTITVNRREARSTDGSVTMQLKDREDGYHTWDEKLTFRFRGSKPAIAGIELVKMDNALTVFLCGNSTVVDQLDDTWCAWGQMIPRFFKSGVVVANYAESGLTAGAFLSMRRLDKIMAEAKAGDYVFVEFGHNDQKNSADVSAYPGNLKKFRDQIVAKQAIPVFVIPTARQGDRDPKTSIAGLAEVMRKQAVALNVTAIDLNAMVIQVLTALGANEGAAYKDDSHFTEFGGYELGRCVAKAIKELNNNLTPFLIGDLPDFDPTKPDPINYLTRPGTPTALSILAGGRAATSGARAFSRIGKAGLIEYSSPEAGEGAKHIVNGREVGAEPAAMP